MILEAKFGDDPLVDVCVFFFSLCHNKFCKTVQTFIKSFVVTEKKRKKPWTLFLVKERSR